MFFSLDSNKIIAKKTGIKPGTEAKFFNKFCLFVAAAPAQNFANSCRE